MELTEFVKEKLIQYNDEIEEFEKQFQTLSGPPGLELVRTHPPSDLPYVVLEKIKDELLELEAFKGVKKINLIKYPSYFTDIHTGDVLTELQIKERTLTDGKVEDSKQEFAVSYLIHTGGEYKTVFNEEVDIYLISLSPIMYDTEVLQKASRRSGVWLHPTTYSPETFLPHKKVQIVWSPEEMQDKTLTEKEWEEAVDGWLKEAKELMFNSEIKTNIPGAEKQSVMIRLSSRSIKKVEENV